MSPAIAEIVKTAIERLFSWPVAAVILALRFGEVLTELLRRISSVKAGPSGVDIQTDAALKQAEAQPQTPDKTVEAPRSELAHVTTPALVRKWEDWIKRDLAKMALSDDQATIALLINKLAEAQLAGNAERVYRVIFGSQIGMLKMLNLRGSVPEVRARAIYEEASGRFPNLYSTYPFEKYMNFLVQFQLITVEDDCVSITAEGTAFLAWMVAARVGENKPF